MHGQILGERLVLSSNMRSNLATVALRPSGIFGEHDPLLVPLTVANAKKGKMKFIIGSGKNLMDFTYVGNVAQAHLLVSNPPLLPHIMALFFMLPCKSSRTCEGLVLSATSIDACGAVMPVEGTGCPHVPDGQCQ